MWRLLRYNVPNSAAVGVKFTPSLRSDPPPLVPVERIRKGLNICPSRLNGCYLLQLDETTILKVGRMVQMGEAEAMILVKNLTSGPVAQVLNAYMIEEIGFILMEKIHGCQIGESWPALPRVLKHSIAQELQSYMQQLQQMEGSRQTDILSAEELPVFGTNQEEVKILTHGDMDQSNIMIRDGKIIGIIDWGAAGYSVPEREYYALRWPALDPVATTR
ncbi:Protein kinase-like domain [Penicillium camemberti]|uniref:Protein kinase-like domain n=1 Tax=Penicillium camemberti (strain FM 013) TaxID=1429867 RepID=A0A0G4P058_PENC3|nr:Protein kinase-like domain [Penicillium camemberti]